MKFKDLKVGDRFRYKGGVNKLTKVDDFHSALDTTKGDADLVLHSNRTAAVIRLVKKKKPATEALAQYRDLTEAELKCLPKEAEFLFDNGHWERTTAVGFTAIGFHAVDADRSTRYRMPASIPPPQRTCPTCNQPLPPEQK